jgi:hypothetical protein
MNRLELEMSLLEIFKEYSPKTTTETHGEVSSINICFFNDIRNYITKILNDNNIEVIDEQVYKV